MKKTIISLFSLSALAVIGCTGTTTVSEDGVDVLTNKNIYDEGDLTEIACDFKVYPLIADEPIDDIGGIKFFGDKAFARNGSDNKVLCFDNYQMYAVLDKQGNGPGEYNSISDFSYDQATNILNIPLLHDSIILEYNAQTMEYLGKRRVNFVIQNMRNVGDKVLYNGRTMKEYNKIDSEKGTGYQEAYFSVILADKNENDLMNKSTVLSEQNYLHTLMYGSPQVFYVSPVNLCYSLPGYVNRIVSFNDDSITTLYRFRLASINPPAKYTDGDYSKFENVTAFYISWITDMQKEPTPEEIYNIIVDDGTISFLMRYYPEGIMSSVASLYWVHDNSGTKAYKSLRIPGIKQDIKPTGAHDNRNVAIIENLGEDAIDSSAKMSPLAQQILDAMKKQKYDNPVLVEFRFK